MYINQIKAALGCFLSPDVEQRLSDDAVRLVGVLAEACVQAASGRLADPRRVVLTVKKWKCY
jgi:hypothetical protein